MRNTGRTLAIVGWLSGFEVDALTVESKLCKKLIQNPEKYRKSREYQEIKLFK